MDLQGGRETRLSSEFSGEFFLVSYKFMVFKIVHN